MPDQHLDIALRVIASTRGDGLQSIDVPVVVGPQHIDLSCEATVLLVEVVRRIRGEVCRLPRRAQQHPVLVVTEIGRAQPHSPIGVEDVALLAQPLHCGSDRAGVVQRLLGEPHVEVHRKRRQRVFDLLDLKRRTVLPRDDQRLIAREAGPPGRDVV